MYQQGAANLGRTDKWECFSGSAGNLRIGVTEPPTQRERAGLMTILELCLLGNSEQAPQAAMPVPDQPVPPATAPDGLLRFQLGRLMRDIVADPDLDPDIYLSLIGHLAVNPGRPERALLAHLCDVLDAEDLPRISPIRHQEKGAKGCSGAGPGSKL